VVLSHPSEKMMEFISWDDFPFPTEWKDIKIPWFQSPPTSMAYPLVIEPMENPPIFSKTAHHPTKF
jgi:hypothetical protein